MIRHNKCGKWIYKQYVSKGADKATNSDGYQEGLFQKYLFYGKLQLHPAVYFWKVILEHSHFYVLSMAAFRLQQQSWVVDRAMRA